MKYFFFHSHLINVTKILYTVPLTNDEHASKIVTQKKWVHLGHMHIISTLNKQNNFIFVSSFCMSVSLKNSPFIIYNISSVFSSMFVNNNTIISWHNSPLRARACQLTAGLMFTCLQTEVNDCPARLGVTCGQNVASSSCWLSRPMFIWKLY